MKKLITCLIVFLLVFQFLVPTVDAKGRDNKPVAVNMGGTGATSAEAARTALGVTSGSDVTAHIASNSTHGCTNIASAAAITALSSVYAPLTGSTTQEFTASRFNILSDDYVLVPGGGLAFLATNKSVSVNAGALVRLATSGTDLGFMVCEPGAYPDGILYANCANGASNYVVVAGAAENVVLPSGSLTGEWAMVDEATAGAATNTYQAPTTSSETYKYIGRIIKVGT